LSDNERVYWTTAGGISACSVRGCGDAGIESVAVTGGPNGLAIGSSDIRVYFSTSAGPAGGLKDPADGGPPFVVFFGGGPPPTWDPTPFANSLLVASPQVLDGPIWGCYGLPACGNGGSAFVRVPDPALGFGTMRHFVLRAGTVWMTTTTGIWSAPAQAFTTALTHSYKGAGASVLAVDDLGTRIFWASDEGGIYGGLLSGSEVSAVAPVLPNVQHASGMVIDGVLLFYADRDRGTVSRYNALTNSVDVLIDGLAQPLGAAIDTTYVYATSSDGRILRAGLRQ
jgi:hypothetical protein